MTLFDFYFSLQVWREKFFFNKRIKRATNLQNLSSLQLPPEYTTSLISNNFYRSFRASGHYKIYKSMKSKGLECVVLPLDKIKSFEKDLELDEGFILPKTNNVYSNKSLLDLECIFTALDEESNFFSLEDLKKDLSGETLNYRLTYSYSYEGARKYEEDYKSWTSRFFPKGESNFNKIDEVETDGINLGLYINGFKILKRPSSKIDIGFVMYIPIYCKRYPFFSKLKLIKFLYKNVFK